MTQTQLNQTMSLDNAQDQLAEARRDLKLVEMDKIQLEKSNQAHIQKCKELEQSLEDLKTKGPE